MPEFGCKMRRMRVRLTSCVLAAALAPALLASGSAGPSAASQPASSVFSAEEVFSFPFPSDLTGAAAAPRVTWALNEQGRRNVWVAEAPAFSPRQLTRYAADDGQEVTSLSLSPAGDWVVFVRGGDHGANWDDTLPVNPLGLPLAPKVQIWSAPFAGGEPRLIGEGDYPVISPRGDVLAFEHDRHLWVAPIDASAPATRILASSGSNGSIAWSPDGSRLAFVSNRGDHAFVGIYANEQTPVTWIAPSTSRDSMPRWSPDGGQVVFVRRPGVGGPPEPVLTPRQAPWALWIGDASSGTARRLWKAPETLRGSIPGTDGGVNLHWAARDRIVFVSYHGGWPQLYSLPSTGGEPLTLTPPAYMVEHVRLTPDRAQLVFAANAGPASDDIDRRHVVRVPVDRATPEVLTPGTGLEWNPVTTGGGSHIVFLGATAQRPPLPAVMPASGGAARLLAEDRVPASFPTARLVSPRAVTYKASDGVVVHGQLFEPPSVAGKRPAILYVHGGPQRQMLLGWHYSDYYARAYAANQYLASRGFVVLSINYRLGIGYGYEFHRPADGGAQGASEYRDVKAAGEYLRTLPQVDGARIGIYGGSYGGFLTALALGRDSDLFAAGVDIHGVHDFTVGGSGSGAALQAAMAAPGRSAPPDRDKAADIAWTSSPVSTVDSWKSPVLLIHGDEDRNVRFSQTVDLARRLEAAGVPYEEMVVPDDTHHWMRHANVLRVYKAAADWFERRLGAADKSQMNRR